MFRYGKYIRPGFALALAVTYPFYWSHMFTIPILGRVAQSAYRRS